MGWHDTTEGLHFKKRVRDDGEKYWECTDEIHVIPEGESDLHDDGRLCSCKPFLEPAFYVERGFDVVFANSWTHNKIKEEK